MTALDPVPYRRLLAHLRAVAAPACSGPWLRVVLANVVTRVYDRRYLPSLLTAVVVAVISAWTIVASLIFSQPTVQNLALGASFAISGLAVVGLTAHEVSLEQAAQSVKDSSTEREGRLAAAA